MYVLEGKPLKEKKPKVIGSLLSAIIIPFTGFQNDTERKEYSTGNGVRAPGVWRYRLIKIESEKWNVDNSNAGNKWAAVNLAKANENTLIQFSEVDADIVEIFQTFFRLTISILGVAVEKMI